MKRAAAGALLAGVVAGCAQPAEPESAVVAATSHAGPQHASRSHVRQPRIGSALVIVRIKVKRPSALHLPTGYNAWRTSRATRAVFTCESHWNPRAVNPSGKYRGLIQADARFWRTYGGLAFAPRPDLATTGEQLRIAYGGWLARGWQPWTCARIVGVL